MTEKKNEIMPPEVVKAAREIAQSLIKAKQDGSPVPDQVMGHAKSVDFLCREDIFGVSPRETSELIAFNMSCIMKSMVAISAFVALAGNFMFDQK